MGFISNAEKEGRTVGSVIRLTRNVDVLSGTFTAGSVLDVIQEAASDDYRQEFACRDRESGETVWLSPVLGGYEKVR